MLFLALAAMVGADTVASAHPVWRCRNQIEVWCTADGCAATKSDEFTPMDITADPNGGLSICAYSGCWESQVKAKRRRGRALWAADDARFSTNPGGERSQATLLVFEKDGVGFVRIGALATPLLCSHEPAPAGSP
ncbi:MAG TPA: hypothetical protein VNH64_01875 [Parvularculaceae bacterium]|nr:hypothetical protein [Parvularculaceae bacterium]